MFKEKVAVITGGAGGIGLATTKKLLSDDASFITGAIIPIDDGFTAK